LFRKFYHPVNPDSNKGKLKMQRFKISLLIIGLIVSGCATRPPINKNSASSVSSVAFSPNGKLALSGSWDNSLKLWDINSGQQIRSFKGHSDNVNAVAFSPNGKLALSGSMDDTLKLWEVNSGREIRSFKEHSDDVNAVAFSPDGKLALSGSSNTLKLWEVNSGREIRSFKGHSLYVYVVAFSPDGKLALSGSIDNTLKLWKVNSGQEIRSFKGYSGSVNSVAFSPDGKLVLSGSLDNTLKLWEVNSGREIRYFKGHSRHVNAVAFSPDGKLALSGSMDDTLKLWEVNSGREIRHFKGHSSSVNSVAFSPDGKLALSGSRDDSSRLWNVQTGEEIVQMIGFDDGEWLSITPEGYYVASANGEKRLKNPSPQFNKPEKVRLALQPFTTQFAQSIPPDQPKPIQTAIARPKPLVKRDTTPPRIILNDKTRGPENSLVIDTIAHTLSGQAIDESGIASISVNGKSIRFNEQGYFSAPVQLQIGNNPIRVTATDNNNNTASKNIILARAEPPKPILFAGNYHALVIGINHYPHFPEKDNLDMAVNDARAVAKILANNYGFKVTLLLDKKATREGILDTFNSLNKELNANDHFLIYYSGHGVYDKKTSTAYWLPTNAKKDSDTQWIEANTITTQIKRNLAKKVLIVADSCYSGTLTRNLEDIDLFPTKPRQQFLQKMLEKPSRLLMSSGGNEPVLDSGGKGHSIFAQAFLDGLRQIEEDAFTALDLFTNYIRERVAGMSKQTPEYKLIQNSGHQGGEFVFQRR
jgi:WD40 repeat protein